jgi:2-polyprenyl-6-methoxyphenol hydroxylase-like FAD-dependent oxidoreductase
MPEELQYEQPDPAGLLLPLGRLGLGLMAVRRPYPYHPDHRTPGGLGPAGRRGRRWEDGPVEYPSPIIIAGAGIAGLTLAASLARSGPEVVVVEAGRSLADTGSGITLWPNALAALDVVGLGDEVRATGGAVSSGGVRRPDGSWIRTADPRLVEAVLGEPMITIHRRDLLAILAAPLDPSTIRFGVPVASFGPSGDGVQVSLGDGSVLHGRGLVGADGIGSVVAEAIQPNLGWRYSGYTAWRGVSDLDVSGIDPGETWGPGGEFGFLPLGRYRAYWFATENTPARGRSPDGELGHLLTRFGGWHHPIPALLRSTDPSAVLRHDIHDRPALRSWSDGPVIAIGDAAHPMRPHLGQGGCQSIEDAVLLASMIRGGAALAPIFTEFSTRRRRRLGPIIRQSAVVGRVIQGESTSAALLRRLGTLIPSRLVAANLARFGGRDAFGAGI